MDAVCRTCMRILEPNEAALSINDSDLKDKLKVCLPELVLDNVLDPKMCGTCSAALSLSFRFKGMCNDAENTINSCIRNKKDGDTNPLNKVDLLTLGRRDIGDILVGDGSTITIADEVEVESSSDVKLEPLKLLSDVAASISKAHADLRCLSDNTEDSQSEFNWDEEIKSSRIERKIIANKKTVSKHIEDAIERAITGAFSNASKVESPRTPDKIITRSNTAVDSPKPKPSPVASSAAVDTAAKTKPLKLDKTKTGLNLIPETVISKTHPSNNVKKGTLATVTKNLPVAAKSKRASLEMPKIKESIVNSASKAVQSVKNTTQLPKSVKTTTPLNSLVRYSTPRRSEVLKTSKGKSIADKMVLNFESQTPSIIETHSRKIAKTVVSTKQVEGIPISHNKTKVDSKNTSEHRKTIDMHITSQPKKLPQVALDSSEAKKINKRQKQQLNSHDDARTSTKNIEIPKRQKIHLKNPQKKIDKKESDLQSNSETKPPQSTSDFAKAIEKLLQTPEYKILLQLQKKSQENSPQSKVAQKLQQLDTFFKEHEHKQTIATTKPPRTPKRKLQEVTSKIVPPKKKLKLKSKALRKKQALEDINLDLAEINIGVKRQQEALISISPKIQDKFTDSTVSQQDVIEMLPIHIKSDEEYVEEKSDVLNLSSITDIDKQKKKVKLPKVKIRIRSKLSRLDGRSFRQRQPPQMCDQCGKVFPYISHLNVHMRAHVHLKSFKCELCGKGFTLERYLVAHTMLHFSAGNHQCSTCEKYFSSWHVLKKHERTHSGLRPFVCEFCNRAFTQRVNLETHVRIHTGTKDFICYICNAAFGQKVHLVSHIRIHTGERPYVCDLCPKAYTKSNVLRDHKKLHLLKPFMCDGCHTLFRDELCLKRHLNRYRDCSRDGLKKCAGKTYNCGICNRYFTSRFSRDRHMKVHVIELIQGISSKV